MSRASDNPRRFPATRLLDRLRRYASSPMALARSLKLLANSTTVCRSPLFDADWYRRETLGFSSNEWLLALHYLACGADAGLDPGPAFCGAEYVALNPEAGTSGLNPLIHYERIGRRLGSRTAFLQPEGRDGLTWCFPSLSAHQEAFPAKVAAIRARAACGMPIRAVFLVANASMFPMRPLLDVMRRDPRFDSRIAVIPDLRGIDGGATAAAMGRCRAILAVDYPDDIFLPVERDAGGQWPDVIGRFGADIVSYPSPYDLSAFRYNPRWSVGRDFLPIYLSYSFSTSLHGYGVYRLPNYAYFWKVFTECDANTREYAEHSVLKGANAETVGYFKMDSLAAAKPWPRNGSRRRVLIAPHHSVDGGANDSLALSNFERYADSFLALPERHPELDFVFRPHPFLFAVLARPNKWGQEKVDEWIARMKAHPNVRWSDEGDYFPAFASCDAIVQDCGSYLAEWLYTGKPCCFMLKSPSDIGAKFTPLGRDILSHCYLAYDEAAIESFLRDVVEGGDDPKATARDEFRKTVMLNYPHAAEAAHASIKRNLGIA